MHKSRQGNSTLTNCRFATELLCMLLTFEVGSDSRRPGKEDPPTCPCRGPAQQPWNVRIKSRHVQGQVGRTPLELSTTLAEMDPVRPVQQRPGL